MMKRYILLCTLSLFIFSCSVPTTDIPKLTIDPEKAAIQEFSDVMKITGINTLKSNDSILIGEVNDFIKFQDTFYILDNKTKSVYIFNNQGNCVKRINSYGEGPNEYRQLSCFYIDPFTKRLILVDNSKKTRYLYTLEGSFIKTEKEDFAVKSVNFLADGTKAVVRDMVDSNAKSGYYIYVTSSNNATSSFLPFSYQSGSLIFEKNHPLTTVGNRFYYNSIASDTIYEYRNGHLSPQYMISFSGKGVFDHIKNTSTNQFGESFYKLLQEHPNDIAYWPQIINEKNNMLLLGYVYGNDMCFCIYDLVNGCKNQFLGPYIGSTSLTQISSGIFPSDNELYFVLDSYKISQITASSMNEIKQHAPDLYEAMATNSLEDNPIIVSTEFKFDVYE